MSRVAHAGAQLGQRREPGLRELAGERRVGVQHELRRRAPRRRRARRPAAGRRAQLQRAPRALGAARAAGERDRRAERGGQPGDRLRELRARRRARSGSGTNASTRGARRRSERPSGLSSGAATAPGPSRLASRSESMPSATSAAIRAGGRQPARTAAARTSSGRRGRVGGEQEHEARAAALALAGGGGLLGRVARDRLAGDLVDVGEDRLAEAVERRRLEVGPHAGLDEAPPGDLRADAVGGQQRVERAALAHLQAAELEVDAPVAVADRRRRLDRVDEAAAARARCRSAASRRDGPRAGASSRAPRGRSRGSSPRRDRAEPGARPLLLRGECLPFVHNLQISAPAPQKFDKKPLPQPIASNPCQLFSATPISAPSSFRSSRSSSRSFCCGTRPSERSIWRSWSPCTPSPAWGSRSGITACSRIARFRRASRSSTPSRSRARWRSRDRRSPGSPTIACTTRTPTRRAIRTARTSAKARA